MVHTNVCVLDSKGQTSVCGDLTCECRPGQAREVVWPLGKETLSLPTLPPVARVHPKNFPSHLVEFVFSPFGVI